jgi:2-polyprenyl-3-methyl-5-hydroxy-6-metoxy-1,4-benzoquinol methylase
LISFSANSPNLEKVINHITQKSPFQKKALLRYLESADQFFFTFAEDWILRLLKAIDKGDCHDYIADAYLAYTKMIRIEEMYFFKERKYRYSNFDEVYHRVYGREDHMLDYVVGLGMTQLFWPNHFAIVRYYLSEFIPLIENTKIGAEVGVGHGLFHSELLKGAPRLKTTMLDISSMSLKFTQKIIEATGIDKNRATAKICDIQRNCELKDESLDVLLLGELIEHLQEGESVLQKMNSKLRMGGYCFFTTAANAPAEDHLLLFKNTEEIRNLLSKTGWTILHEHLGTLGGMSIAEAENGGHNINYAAILTPN